MAQALYRKYRSKSFDEIVGQKSVVKALKTAVDNNLISHAYLFTGPRGVGKTSIARILAYEIIDTPYRTDELPLDIIEIDAASNRGIEEIRDLREKVRMAPVSAKRKVYIIDEVHMLTTHAFNALLKTLEEPPKHVVFILATTESHKVPETITSRTQKFNFTLASTEEVQSHLNDIAKKENIKISDEALTTIARHSGGSLRDALSALDHVRHMSNDISDALVREAIGAPDIELTKSILNAVETNNVPGLLNIISNNSYISIVALAKDLLNLLIENLQSNKLNLSLEKTNSLMQKLILVENSSQPEMQLLIALLGSINESNSGEIYKSKTINKSVNQPKTNIGIRAHSKDTTTPVQSVAQSNSITDLSNEDLWPTTLEDIRATHNTLYSILRMAEYNRVDDTVYLGCQFDFHKKRLNESKNKEIIMRALAKNTTSKLKLIIGTKESKKSVAQESNPVSSEIDAIRMVFNGAEPLE